MLVYAIAPPPESTPKLIKTISVNNAIEIAFSPKGTYIATWIRHVKLEDDQQHKNLQVWSTASSTANGVSDHDEASEATSAEQCIIAFTQKDQNSWKLQYTEDEAFALRSITNEVHILSTAKDFSLVDKLRLEGLSSFSLSPGRNPSVAVFIAERKGMPASIRIHSLSTLATPSIQKSFFKADRGQMKWNASGTSLLFLSSTDHDKTGKSYYGETNLYLLTPALQYEARVVLDKEGGIGDFAWNPAHGGKEFVVSYGYMPAKSTLFDTRLNVLHDFGALPRNFVSFNPQGRLLCVAGFGNLAGQIDIWDRSTLKKVANFQASNCTECTWSPDGRFLMCATLSPRLRVDNGVKVYHWSGELIHFDLVAECYQANWRPLAGASWTFPRSLSPAPPVSDRVQAMRAAKAAAASMNGGSEASTSSIKPAATGVYRPPGLRGREVPAVYKREDEGGMPSTPSKPSIPGMTAQQPNGHAAKGRGRVVPGAGAPLDRGTPGRGQQNGNNHRKNGQQQQSRSGTSTPNAVAADMQNLSVSQTNGTSDYEHSAPVTPAKPSAIAHPSSTNGIIASDSAVGTPLTPEDKKRRALQKKLGAIDQLKAKRSAGEKLEKTQLQKIEAEDEVKKELAALH